MKIYIDEEYKCHISYSDGFREVEDAFFDDKCDKAIECFRYIPEGETWTREDGEIFEGKQISLAVDSRIMDAYQAAYEDVLNSADNAYREGVDSI